MIVLDTHAWIWWAVGSKKLPVRVRRRLDSAAHLAVSAISCWEVAMLVSRGRLKLDRPLVTWVRSALELPNLSVLADSGLVSVPW